MWECVIHFTDRADDPNTCTNTCIAFPWMLTFFNTSCNNCIYFTKRPFDILSRWWNTRTLAILLPISLSLAIFLIYRRKFGEGRWMLLTRRTKRYIHVLWHSMEELRDTCIHLLTFLFIHYLFCHLSSRVCQLVAEEGNEDRVYRIISREVMYIVLGSWHPCEHLTFPCCLQKKHDKTNIITPPIKLYQLKSLTNKQEGW